MEYTDKQKQQRKEAVMRYQAKVDRVNCMFPAGTKDRIKDLTGQTCNAFIKTCVLAELDRIERLQKIAKD